VPKRCTLINVINKCCTPSVFVSIWIFGIAETGIAHGSPPGTTTEVLRVGFPSAEIRFVSISVGLNASNPLAPWVDKNLEISCTLREKLALVMGVDRLW
jgi:hypothetical protein